MSIEKTIFSNLLQNEQYARKAIPFLKKEYFQNNADQIVYELIDNYIIEYNARPTRETLEIDLNTKTGLTEQQFQECSALIQEITVEKNELANETWLLETTEKFCQDKAIYNAIMGSIKIMEDPAGSLSKGAIPQLLSDALAVSFDTSIGHDFIEDADERFEFYHRKENKVAFDIDIFNKITGGGLPNKTLNLFIAGTNVGKSLIMCHMAAANLMDAKNVLYITLEMSEERIAERIDANLLDVSLDDLKLLPKSTYDSKMARLKTKKLGKLIVKEYPTASAGSANFRHLLNELKIKKNFVPDIIYIDYLSICSSSRLKANAQANTYVLVKTIAEEIRGLAIEFNVPIVSAVQTNRGGLNNSDVTLTETSESIGIAFTADWMVAAVSTEELEALGQILFIQLKSRYGDKNNSKRFVVGVDKSKMRLYNAEDSAQKDLVDDTPVFNNTTVGKRDYDPEASNFKSKFQQFK